MSFAVHHTIRERFEALLAKLQDPTPGPPPPEDHSCVRCTRVADHAERAGQPRPAVLEAESWIGWNGGRYWAATCRDHTDLEFSERWQRRYQAARTEDEKAALEAQLDAWTRRGRRYVGTGRPGAPALQAARPHLSTCRCEQCRSPAIAMAHAPDDDTSLFPPGYAP